MVDDDSDEMLGVRLDSALRAGLDLKQVDVVTLLQGSQRRAQRVRTQRIGTAVAAAVLVVAMPVGYEVLNPGVGATAPPAVMLPSTSAPAETRVTAPSVWPDPTAAASAVPPSKSFSTTILDSFAFNRTELPAGLAFELEAQNAGGAIVDGQVCNDAVQGAQPVVTRRWVWSTSPGTAGDLSVSLTVTGWAEGEAAPAFAAAIEGAGNCTWEVPQTQHPLPDVSADQSWAATSKVDGRHYSRAVVRLGDGIVGVQVQDPKSAETATELADRLAAVQAIRLRSALKGSPTG